MRRERDKKQQERLADAADVTAELETRVDAGAPSAEAAGRQTLANSGTAASEDVAGQQIVASAGTAGAGTASAGTASAGTSAPAQAQSHGQAHGLAQVQVQSQGQTDAPAQSQSQPLGQSQGQAHAHTHSHPGGSAGAVSPGAEQAAGPRRAAGALESAVLGVLWSASEPLSPGEVREKLARSEAADGGPALSYSTVVTILTRLHEKRALSRQRDGRAYRYAPLADEAGLAARRLSQLLDRAPDREAVLSRFVADLSERDEQVLRDLLGGRGDGAGSSGTA